MPHSSVWAIFIQELQDNILPLYHARELPGGFDPYQVHGRLHICRAILFSEWMARFHDRHACEPLDHYPIWIAVAFHDSMREDGGPDQWESHSSTACQNYLIHTAAQKTGFDETRAQQAAGWILKTKDRTVSHTIVHDADVLEYMRLLPTVEKFGRDHFSFAGPEDPLRNHIEQPHAVREALIQEAWNWIRVTKHALRQPLLHSHAYMEDVLTFLGGRRREFPLLAEVLSELY